MSCLALTPLQRGNTPRYWRQCARLLLRADQKFLWGEDVKAELRRLNAHYLDLPEIEQKKGILAFAHWPPKDGDFLTAHLFDHFEPSWRDDKPITKLPPEVEKGIVDRMNAMIKSKDVLPADTGLDDENLRELSIQHRVRRKKGSWYQVAADLVVPPEARGK